MTSPQSLKARSALLLASLACTVLVAVAARAAEAVSEAKPEGSTELRLTLSGRSVQVVLWLTHIGTGYPYKDALLWGGDVGELPQRIVSSIEIHDGAEMVFVPLSAYGDLGDVKSASLEPTSHGFVLNLHGGNTAASYDARLTFEADYLVARTVTLREFPKQRREDTRYSFPKRTGE